MLTNKFHFHPLACGLLLGLAFSGGPLQAHGSDASTSDESVLRATLDNGLSVVILRDTLAPVVSTQITYLAGGYETPAGFPGTAHALEHMMFRDSDGMTGAQLSKMTGKLGASNNAFTTNDATQYFFDAPAAYLDVLLRIEATRMQGARVDDKGWALEKGAIEQEISRHISNPAALAYQKVGALLYAGTGYAADAGGTRSSFDKTDGKLLRKFHHDWYGPNNAILVIAGDLEPQATLAQVRRLFGPIPRRDTPERAPIALQPIKAETLRHTTSDAAASLQFSYRVPGQQSEDYAASDVLMSVLNNPRSPLQELAVQGKVMQAGAIQDEYIHGGIGTIRVDFAKDRDAAQVQAQVDEVIDAILKDGVSPELVEAAKRMESTRNEFRKGSANGRASTWSMALAWRGLQSPEQAEAELRAVTAEDVNRVARTYLKRDARITTVLTPDADGQRPPDSQGFGGSESFAADEKLDVALPDWAEQALRKLELPHWTLAPIDMKLSNGLRLIVQPVHTSKAVAVYGKVDQDADIQEPVGKEGVSSVLESLFDYGTVALDRTAFHKALDDIAANAAGGSEFELNVLSDKFEPGMRLLAENQLQPRLPPEAFEVQRELLADQLAGAVLTPGYKSNRAMKKGMLPAGDPQLREALPATVDGLTLEDVKRYFAANYRPDLTTLVIVGDVTPEQAKAVVEKHFGQWKATGPKPDVLLAPVPLNPAGQALVEDPNASQAQVGMAQTMGLTMYDPDSYALELGNEVLGGNGFASRLMTDLRVRHGYVYGASSRLIFDRSRSFFYVSYGSDPDKVAPAEALVRKNLQAMRTTPLSDGEMDNARQSKIRSIPLQVASVSDIADALLTWGYQDLPLDQPMVAAKAYLGLTAEQVRDAYQKYVQPDHLMQIVTGPPPAAP